MKKSTQLDKAQQFHTLHQKNELLVLANIWDSLGAILLESMQFPAIATASAAIAYTNGKHDGEQITFKHLTSILDNIVKSVDLPVTADIESGYAQSEKELATNIKELIELGIIGINIEDTDKSTGQLLPIEEQCRKISLIKQVADEKAIPLFINARTDVFIHENNFESYIHQLDEAIKRGLAYKKVGAHGLFPIAIKDEITIQKLVKEVQLPLNILTIPGIPNFKTLKKIGVSRISLGPSFLKIAIKAMKNLAIKLKTEDGLEDILTNEITNDYLKNLIQKHY